ncbi:MAG: methyltransferase domain-containing protein [Armatimonadota bacterium]
MRTPRAPRPGDANMTQSKQEDGSFDGSGVQIGPSGAPGAALTANANNPYHRAAGIYERSLSLPIISAIRRQEARAVSDLIARYADPSHRALEIGPGTGFYTLDLAQKFREVVAVEDSASMADILRGKLTAAGAQNVTVINQNFFVMETDAPFDVAVAIGVLDYVSEPVAFVTRMCEIARRAVIFTAPRRGLLGWCFVAANRFRGTNVYCYDQTALAQWAPDWLCTTEEVGMKTSLTRGLTLVASFEKPEAVRPLASQRP